MLKRIAMSILLCGLIAGCRSSHIVDVGESVTGKNEPVAQTETNAVFGIPEPDEPSAANAVSGLEMQSDATESNVVPETMGAPAVAVAEAKSQERNKVMILMKTSMGDITLELDKEQAPKTVENFLSYVDAGHYDGTIFHRVINGFMIQGGGFDASMNQKPAPRTVENEANNGLHNLIGSIAMARTPNPHSASAQFFINVNDNTNLDYPSFDGWGYCVFGKVVDGMDVVNAIKEVPTHTVGPHQNVPSDPVLIESVVVTDQ